jgi:hypothetical protein
LTCLILDQPAIISDYVIFAEEQGNIWSSETTTTSATTASTAATRNMILVTTRTTPAASLIKHPATKTLHDIEKFYLESFLFSYKEEQFQAISQLFFHSVLSIDCFGSFDLNDQ